ncbi:hypothetical protein [Erythrobacter neustonensis]|nr:hypothetical protein [Erythrobacter neustonensis]
MKSALYLVAATAALIATGAQAQSHTSTRVQFNNPVLGATNIDTPFTFGEALAGAANNGLLLFNIGTRITTTSTAADDTEAATPTVANTFTLTGTVNRDCSFYAGNTAAARSIDFGVIGVRTGNNENVNAAFEMAGPATANVQTLTAGCNTNNAVEVSKDDIRGMVNANPGGYDTDEFQANIPYSVTATWTGVGLNAVTAGTSQTLTVAGNANAGSLQQGAWRSAMNIAFNAPAITDRGLVAGTYTGTTTVTLRAL